MTQQALVFEQAKQSVAHELDEEILAWDFSQMLAALRAAITNISSADQGPHRVRFFCRHYLAMSGDSYKDCRRWLSEEAEMPFEKIRQVLRVLQEWRQGKLPEVIRKQKRESKPKQVLESNLSREPEPIAPKTTGMIRKLVDHTTTLFNSLMILIIEAGVNPNDLFDGDRIQIRIALKQICDAFGIDVIFPESTVRNQRVTREDFEEIGLKETRTRRRKG